MVFEVALSGIQASTKDLEVTGNNIANSATDGFKSSRIHFADLYSYGTYGSGSSAVGHGVKVSRISQSFTTTGYRPTNSSLDLSINGNGFFVLSDNGAKIYSRAGNFTVDKDNYIVNGNNQRLNGLRADSLGNITGATGDIQISRANIAPLATSNARFDVNMVDSATPSTANWAGGSNPTVDTYYNTSTSTVYDSLGNAHRLTAYFIKADSSAAAGAPNAASPPGTMNQWYVAYQIDGVDVPPLTGTQNTDNLFRVNFNPDGTFANAQDTTNTNLTNNLIPLSLNLGNGSNTLNINVDMTSCTQYGGTFSARNVTSDGYATGSFAGLNVSESGQIVGRYTNGLSMVVGQLQLAKFASEEGLQNLGNVAWAETIDSGQPVVGVPLSSGLGSIKSGYLEQSNVDLTGELVHLISAQRNFQANAQTIRTGDAITQTIINIR